MNIELPNFTQYGYELKAELGINLAGGRVTYLAAELPSKKQVVVKQFQFAKGADWSGYKAIEREIEMLKSLEHPNIPKYIRSFQTDNGLCLVQEFIAAQPLSAVRFYSLQQIHKISRSILEILIYLQSLYPPILHRDIQPGNILMNAEGQIYLIDFGFARVSNTDLAVSSMVAGTMGFMAPEQIYGRELTLATDLYGLGATLICLLSGTKATDIGKLVDENLKFKIDAAIDQKFMVWLQRLVEPNPAKRFRTAQEALKYYLAPAQEPEALAPKRREISAESHRPQRALNSEDDLDSIVKSVAFFAMTTVLLLCSSRIVIDILGIEHFNKVIPQLIEALSHGEK